MFPAADEPPHTGSVENANPQSIPHAVVRSPTTAWPLDDIDKADIEAFTAHQSKQETVETVEIRQRQEQFASECSDGASRISGLIFEQSTAYAVGDSRLQFSKNRRFTPDALTRGEAETGRTLFERGE
jgi:hypothetical protein